MTEVKAPRPDFDYSRNLESVDTKKSHAAVTSKKTKVTPEIGGPKGLEPTRYGDWERKGIAVDF